MVRLALIGDIHVHGPRPSARQYFTSRRIVGHTNLVLTRRRRFNHVLLDPVLDRVRAIKPAQALFSGDVTTTSLDDEFRDVSRYLLPLSEQIPTLLVPGNHDRYTFGSRRSRRVETLMHRVMPASFPALSPLNDTWRLLSLDSAVPNVLSSSGRLGSDQLARAESMIENLTENHGLVVLCHYPLTQPPLTPHHRSHDLKEKDALLALLKRCPARVIYLHGHVHKPWIMLPGPPEHAPFISINAGAPCMTSEKYPLGQGIWQIDLPDHAQGPLGIVHHTPDYLEDDKRTGRLKHKALITDVQWQVSRVM